MALIHNRYGKGRVRVMRLHREGDKHEVRELTVQAMAEGDFAPTYTRADNSASVSTDTIKNVVNVVAREIWPWTTSCSARRSRTSCCRAIRRSKRRRSRAIRRNGPGWRSAACRIRTASSSTPTASHSVT